MKKIKTLEKIRLSDKTIKKMKEQASSLLHAFMRQQVQKDAFSLILI